MTEIPVTSYTFNPTAGTVTFTGFTLVDPQRVAAIYDESVTDPAKEQEFGTPLYFADDAPQASASGNVLTLPTGRIPPQAASTDTLKISYNIDPPEGWEVLKFANVGALPATGVPDTLYLASNTGQLYAWDGAAFVAV